MKKYELLFVLKPTLVEEELQAKISYLKEILEKNSAVIAALQHIGTRKLAYKIQKFERGHYYVFYFEAPSSSILEIERNLRISEDFIKFMTVKYEKQKELKHWNKLVEKFMPKPEIKTEKIATKEEITEE
ncbi:MAG: 30S ribosomal protein S6 [Sulfurospirillum sp.]|nr:30S ribosomal protein S6 [Sulfurospirillum sp.]MBL0703661.1 30S ribosomal protein S6 [Sulfurospirillum sp.]